MLKIRLQRIGRKHEPAFRLVVTESENSTKSGKSLEILGNFDARRGEQAAFKADRITYWIGKGAQVSDTVHNLLVSKKIIEGKKINKLPLKKAIIKEVPIEKAEAKTEESISSEENNENAEGNQEEAQVTTVAEESAPEAPSEPTPEPIVEAVA